MMKRSRNGGWSKSARAAVVVLMCAAGVVGLEGCGKKKTPPPPAPPPKQAPPPEPVPVSFDTISQDMKADARVQFASDLKLEDEDLARSVVKLADALAKGDTDTISQMTTKATRPVLDEMKSGGAFGGAQEPEAVRVVYIGKNDETTGFKMTLDDITKDLSGDKEQVSQAEAKVPPEVLRQVGALIGAALVTDDKVDLKIFEPPITAEKLGKISEAWEKLKGDSSQTAIVEQIQAMLQSATAVPGLKDAEYMALIAVQTPKGVELTGWGIEKAFGKWTFSPASTDGQVKKTAADWDGVGIAGFSRDSTKGIVAAAPAPKEGDAANKEGGEKKDEPNGDEGKKDDPDKKNPDGPVKRTPHGPVKIPGGG
jgi:hypothetical protein